MKKKKIQINKKIYLVIILILVVALGVIFIFKNFNHTTRTYHSKLLTITIDYPTKYQLEERFGDIILKWQNKEILIHRNGTNYNTLDEVLNNAFGSETLPQNISKKQIKINSQDSVIAFVEYPTQPELNIKAYYFYKDYFVYVLSTRSVDLYDDLDRIAESFRYEP